MEGSKKKSFKESLKDWKKIFSEKHDYPPSLKHAQETKNGWFGDLLQRV